LQLIAPLTPKAPARAGFSLLEIVIALAVIAMIVGVIAIRSGGVINKGKTLKILQLVDTLKNASVQYHADTNELPWEYSGDTAVNRKLSGTQTIAGWQGPYIEAPLSSAMHPSYGLIEMHNTSVVNGNDGFDLDGDGTNDVTSNACTLYLSGITQTDAQAIDSAFDKGIPGTWSATGRVRWNSTNSDLFVLVYF